MKPNTPPPPGTKTVTNDETPPPVSLYMAWRNRFEVVMGNNQLNARNLTQPEILFKVLRCWAPATFPSSCHVFMHLLYSKEFKWDNGHLVFEEFRPDAFAISQPLLRTVGRNSSTSTRRCSLSLMMADTH